ncbi:MAG: phosphoribosylglycinamide formyltransferase [Candidatus Marinimicrobia bacterium]|nr:phosphoribosylglycinamide formyltransferase [Candidatus Neomarinimicrobiota bacterium]
MKERNKNLKNIAVFASGRGSNFKAILEEIKKGNIPGKVCCVISDRQNPPVFEIARSEGIPTFHLNRKNFKSGDEYVENILNLLDSFNIDLVVLAGYLKLIPSKVVEKYRNKIVNIHPALLPNFGGKGYYGMKVHEAVIESGVKITGVTVHFVDERYDNGPIILQEPVRVLPEDTPETLAHRVLEVEHKVFPKVVKAFCEDKLEVKGRKVIWKE